MPDTDTLPPDAGTASSGTGDERKPKADKVDVSAVIGAIVHRERERIKPLEDTNTVLRAEIEALKAKIPTTPIETDPAYAQAIRQPLLDKLAALEAKAAKNADKLKSAALKAAAATSVDPSEVEDRLAKFLTITDDGSPEVVDEHGRLRYGASGPMTVPELVAELLAAKPFLAKSTARDGIDLGDSPKRTTSAVETIASLKAEIAALDNKGDFRTAAPLKTRLAHLVASTPK